MSKPAQQLPPPDATDADAAVEPEDEVHLSFTEHLEELRKRLIRSLLGIGVGMAAVGWFSEAIFRWVMTPVLRSLPAGQQQLHYTSYVEPFLVYLKVAMYGGVFVSAPWVLYQVWQFVTPGLYRKEKRLVVPFIVAGTSCFYAGAAACYFLVMPIAFPALAAIAGEGMAPVLTMSEQLSLVLAMLLGFGVVFELPVIMAFLALIGLVTPEFLAKYRRHAIVVNVIIAALITPTTDPMNLAAMAVPLILFYEIGILLARVLGKKRKAAAPA
jgi:sec-independent protein translocase protein TatC